MVERLGIYGGTFDPVHIGHLVVACEARAVLDLDRVLMVVAGDPWQKRATVVAPAAARLAMVEAAVADVPGVLASDIEIARGGPAYTVDTLEALARPNLELFLIVGTDVVELLTTWQRWERVAELCTLGVVERAESTATVPAEPWRWKSVPIPRIDVSSRDIRARAATGRPIDALVPGPALRVLRARGLYTAEQ